MATTGTKHDCPCTADLDGLLRGELPDDRQAELADHVGDCPGCQGKMDSLAAGGDPALSDVVRHIDQAKPPSDSAYWRALNQAEAALTAAYPSDGETPSGELKLDFLQPSDRPGRLGRISIFDVHRVVGRGGMGVVLHGFDPYLQRDVAIKVLDPQLANNELARQRFCREARAAAAVTHDNLVAVHQVDEDEKSGLPFLVMQLVNGESLEQRLRRVGKLSVAEAVRVGMQAAAGLATAHASGLIHRDIKPGNILIEEGTEKVKLTDFGLARTTEDLKLTRTGFVAGTPLYMAPEQARGDDIDHRVDLFSLGSVLYEALAGRPPFEGKTPLAVLRRVADEAHVPLRRLNPEVPGWLEEVIDRLLAKDPADRFQTAAEVSELLAARLAHLGSLSPLEVPAEACPLAVLSGPKWSAKARRKICMKTVAALATVFVVGGVVGGVAVWEFAPPRGDQGTVPGSPNPPGGPTVPLAAGPDSEYRLPARAGAVVSVALAPDGNTLATGIESGRISVWDIRKQEVKFDLHPPGADQQPAHKGMVWAVEYSPDGKQIVSVSDDGTVGVWDAATGERRGSIPVGTAVRSAAVSPDGKWVAFGDRFGLVQVFDLTDQKPVSSYQQESTVNGVAFSPDGQALASVGVDGTAVVWDVKTHRRRFTLTGHTGPVYGLGFAPDGKRLATAGWDGTVILWDTRDGTRVSAIAAHDDGVRAVRFAPCCKVIATAGQDGEVKVWDAEDGKQLAAFGRHRGGVHALRFNKDGSMLITGGRDGDVRIWDTGHCKHEE